MQQHDWSSTSPKGPMSHLSLSHCTGSRLQLTSSSRHWCLHIEQPHTQHPPTSTPLWQYTSPPEVWDLWVSDALWCHPREAQNHSPEWFHAPFLAGGMKFPPSSGMLNPWQFSSNTWKLFCHHLSSSQKKKIPSLPFLNFALFYPNSHRLARICSKQCLYICITSTSFVCLYSSIVSHFG